MTDGLLDVVGIGNAIVDVLARADEAFLARHDLTKGAMTLVDRPRATALYAVMGSAIEVSGGSAANTIAGVASLGGRAGFIGKVGHDGLGEVFRHDIRAGGVVFETPSAASATPTARCLIVVTPDAQRTMSTYLGASVEIEPKDVDAALIGRAKVTYLEGYLWDPPAAKAAFLKAAEAAHAAGRKVALSLSDGFCVERHRAEFRQLLGGHVDILFANEWEIRSLWEARDFDQALQATRGVCELAALTRSARGSVILAGEEVHVADAVPLAKVIDTTGAGDLYAAGFLYGYTRGLPAYDCARIGAIAAAEVISHFGARPETPLASLLPEALAPAEARA